MCPRLPEEIGLSITIWSPIIKYARCFVRETTTCTVAGVICLSNESLILTGSCLEISSDAFRIGLGAASLDGAGLGVARLGPNSVWALREHETPTSKTARSNIWNFAGIDKSTATVAVYALKPTR